MDLPNTGDGDKGEKIKVSEKRVRRFQPNWQDTYTWVYFDDSVGRMFCRICKENPDVADPASAYFSDGCCNFQIMSLQSHAKSKGHINAEEITRMKTGVADNVQSWGSVPSTNEASSPSSSCGPVLSLHQFARPMHLFTNTTAGGTNHKKTNNVLTEDFRAMSKRLLGNVESNCVRSMNSAGSVVFPDMELNSFTGISQGSVGQTVRASSSHQNVDAVESTGESQIIITPSSTSNRLRCMFLNAHAVAKKGLTSDDYMWLCELDIAKDLNVVGSHSPGECQEIQSVIAESDNVKFRNAVDRCKFFSVICDSYILGTKDMIVLYVKTVDNGKQQFHVLDVQSKYTDKIECVSNVLNKVLGCELEGINWKSKLIGVLHDLDMKWYINNEDEGTTCVDSANTDSAPTPIRIKTEPGVEPVQPSSSSSNTPSLAPFSNLLSHRCLLHRIQSFVTDTIKPLPYDRRVSELLRAVRQRCVDLYPSSDEESEDIPQSMATRWPRDRLADVLIFTKKYAKIMETLSKKNKEDTSLGTLIEFCKTQRFVKYIHFLSDLLGVLDNFFRTLSGSNATIGEVYESVSDTIDNVKKLQKRSGQQLVKVEKDPEFHGYFLSSDDVEGFETDRAFILTSVVADLAPRLCTLQEDKMAAMAKLTCLQQWPVATEDLKDYADEDLLLIVETYRNVLHDSGVDTDRCLMEWSQLKNHIRRRFSSPNTTSWESIISTCKGKCENILSVLTFILTLPGHSANVEKGFHYMDNLKKRRIMKAEEIRNQLRIYLSSPCIGQFDPEPYMDKWTEPTTQDGSPPRKRSRRVSRDEDDEAYPVFF